MINTPENVDEEQTDSPLSITRPKNNSNTLLNSSKIQKLLSIAHLKYNAGKYKESQSTCESIYHLDACMKENLLLLGAIHFQLRNFSESIFYNQQAVRIEPTFAEAYGNLGNALKELGDIHAAVQSYLKAIKYKPRFSDAYNNLASAYAQLGDTKQAIDTYEMALLLNPGLADARSNLGNLYKAQGNLETAKRHYQEAIRINPKFTIAWSNLAGIFREQGDVTTAISYYQEAIRLTPEFSDAHSNLGNALRDANRLEESIKSYKEAIRIRPDFAIAHGNLANALFVSGDVAGAIRKYKNAIQLESNFPDAHCNLANALLSIGKVDEAIARYHTALRLKPDHPHAYNNLGNALKDKGLVKEAIHCYMTSCRLMPHFAEAHCNLGSLLKEQGKLEQAIAHYSEAVAINPEFADAHSNMGNAYKEQGNYTEAIRCYRKAIKISPKFAEAYNNLASAFKDAGRLDDAIMCYRKAIELKPDFSHAFANMFHCMSSVCDWRSREDNIKQLNELLMKDISKDNVFPSVQPFHSLGYPLSGETLKLIATKFSKRAKANVALLSLPGFKFRIKMPQSRYKIGYVSSNFGNYPTSHSLLNIFGFHKRSDFEIFCYALRPDDESSQWRHIETSVENFKDLSGFTNSDAAHTIHSDGIHILVNLDGYTKNSRNEIFAMQPAPLQVSFQGYPGTMGADFIHYLICDKHVAPIEHASQFTEKLVHLPNSCIFTDHKQSSMEITRVENCSSREDYGIPEDKFVFCCFNQLSKIDPQIFDVWCRILQRVPNSLLWLLRFPPLGEANLKTEAKARGIDEKRIFFTDTIPRYQHLRRTYLGDLCLDSRLFNGQTTTCDILWSGTPVITLEGETMAARLGSSILRAAGLPDLVCKSLQEYENKAVELSTNMDLVWELRKKIEASRESNALFDTRRSVADIEKAYVAIFKRHEMGLEKDHIISLE